MLGAPELLFLAVVLTVVTLSVLYLVIRIAVRDGFVDGQRRLDAERVDAA